MKKMEKEMSNLKFTSALADGLVLRGAVPSAGRVMIKIGSHTYVSGTCTVKTIWARSKNLDFII